ncbi:hypothetical protein [Aureibacter tunicatorum]|uniref:Uncharacterized protein n=1 Tax=Aureibacter tunicatorum TaxID=866807 RepID=A0AAE4BTG3_9BACT|nr:hypothetical protein [Aureibacter tunicatorum]MDR6239905.1 hypothetical protein [Aureibacter tunicatorum]BDD04380.1 hypothetical protein AUTU_18630 [Aureibacter tunicatorum]
MDHNKGFSQEEIENFKQGLSHVNDDFIVVEEEENGPEYLHFQFLGKYEGEDVIFDAVMYTLRLHHSSELFEIAEKQAAEKFPEYHKITYSEDENGDLESLEGLDEEIGLFLTEVMMELEEEESIKVQEHVDIDTMVEYGVALDIGLNVDQITPAVVNGFIKSYNGGNLKLDKTLYSFVHNDEDDE